MSKVTELKKKNALWLFQNIYKELKIATQA